MRDNGDPKIIRSVTIDLSNSEGRIETLLPKEIGLVKIRISCWDQDHSHLSPLDISENELIHLLQKAIRAGILSSEFLNKLHSEFEI